ncbi:hypothetical protein SteCoe_12064 [Stentor coeruleus]|uniref:Centromere protein J C-terminal domain-containing protein n=1 Tax=Stentor coeruleus TaxID=5963 RepID=A0A1R2CBM0_9CILI|nr:hypothetical protein SteCoe_12064 [Stentor coeruleus]
MDPRYGNYFNQMNPEYMALQANYLRMLADYLNKVQPDESKIIEPIQDQEENILEKSLQAESIFLQNDQSELDTQPIENPTKELISFSPPPKNTFINDTQEDNFFEKSLQNSSFAKEIAEIPSFRQKKGELVELDFDIKVPKKLKKTNSFEEVPIKASSVPFEQLVERELKKYQKSPGLITEPSIPPRVKAEKAQARYSAEEMPLKMHTEETIMFTDPDQDNQPRYSYLKRKSKKITPEKKTIKKQEVEDLELEDNDKPTIGQISPGSKTSFLKRGEGKLCTKAKVTPKNASSANCSKIMFTDKNGPYAEVGVSEKDDVNEKTLYLNEQIQHYNSENAKLQRLIREAEEKKRKLDKDKHDFFKEKDRYQEEFEKWKQEESEKLKKDRQALEKKLKLQSKEKEEIQLLKARVSELQQKLKDQEELHQKTIESYEQQLNALKFSNEYDKSSSEDNYKQEEKAEESLEYCETPEESEESDKNDTFEPEYKPKVGKKEENFSNGIKKETYPDGYSIVYFKNKDVKQNFPDGRTVYYYAEANTSQTTFPDGLQLFKFSSGQIEKHFPDGTKEISFPDGTVKCIFPDGQEESVFPDGTVQTLDNKGVKYIEFVNGQKDTIYPNGVKIRKYPDGRIKKIMPDGKIIEQ